MVPSQYAADGQALIGTALCLRVCLRTIRAVHIEIVHSMDTESFINALRRFIDRRGRPEEIRSDNGRGREGVTKSTSRMEPGPGP